ncbi:MAG: heme-binding domain-containing protein [Anaerolineae bacterium]
MSKPLAYWIKTGLLSLIVVFLLIQLVPYGRHHTNPPVIQEPNWDSPQTRELAQRACFDCHSNETTWPWYTNVAPFSWLAQRDVEVGRQKLNFSEWQGGRKEGERAGEIEETVLEGEMPPIFYLPANPEAILTRAEKQQLIQGLQATLAASR